MKSSVRKVQVIVYSRHPRLRVLLLRRPPHRGSIWQPVTGKVEPGDDDLAAAARRELAEETGIRNLRSLADLGFDFRFTKKDADICERLLAAEVDPDAPVRLSPEHVEAAWLPPGAALERLEWETNREGLRRLLDHLANSPDSENRG